MRGAAVFGCLLVLSACALPVRETIPDEPAAIAAAIKLCNWTPAGTWHAERKEKNWRVWEDGGDRQAYVGRFNTNGTFVCVTP